MNVVTVKPSLFPQLKQTECVISWLLLPNPKSQEGLNHCRPVFYIHISVVSNHLHVCMHQASQSRREQLTLPWHAALR